MKGNRCEVTATALDDAGHGVGVVEGVRYHVADLLPEERAEVAVDHHSPHKAEAWGRVVRRIGARSVDRVTPACPAFGRCGGCAWQHLTYEAQLLEKRERVEVALAEVLALGAVTVTPVRASPQVLGYRNKGKYVVGRSGDRLLLGAYAPRSHHVIDTLGCKVVSRLIDDVATWVRGAAEQAGLIAYDEQTRTGELRYVIIREANEEALVALVITPGTPADKLDRLAAVVASHAAVRGLVAIENDRRDGAIVPSGSTERVITGHGHLIEQLAGVQVVVGAGEFLQVNRAQAAAMYARVAELAALRPGTRAVDLFAGLGGIGLHLARAGADVIAVEIDRDAVTQLALAAKRAGLPLRALAADAGALPAEIRAELGDQPEVVVVNPPRKGLSAGALELVVALAAPTLLYVSCGPTSLGRDLAALAAQGWHVDVVEPFDLMPGTSQVETVVRARRRGP